MTIPIEPPPAADETTAPVDPASSSDAPDSPATPGTAAPTGTASPDSRPAAHGSDRFFLWIGGLGVVRSDGWLGGVAAGIAARLRIDPLIVRGVLVVAALFGLPAIFLYALAWALLPDVDGRIHVRDLLRRDYQPVQLGILAMGIVGLVPTAPLTGSVFGLGYAGWSALSLFSWITGLVLVAALLFLIVRAARRTPGASAPDLPRASADPAAPGASATLSGSGTAEGAGASPPAPEADPVAPPAAAAASDPAAESVAAEATATADPLVPPRPEPPAAPGTDDPDALAAWRAQYASWKERDQAWRREQQDADRAARDQLRRERQAEAAVFAAEAAERRRVRRATNPRASVELVSAVIGVAVITGAAVTLWSGLGPVAGAVGLLAAALVLGLGMAVAGALRRRSGFLAFATIIALLLGLVAGGAASVSRLTFGWASVTNRSEATVTQPFGELYVNLEQHDGGPRPIDITKGAGSTRIDVAPGVQLELEATVGSAVVSWQRVDADTGRVLDTGTWTPDRTDGRGRVEAEIAADGEPVATMQHVTIDQDAGEILVTVIQPAEDAR